MEILEERYKSHFSFIHNIVIIAVLIFSVAILYNHLGELKERQKQAEAEKRQAEADLAVMDGFMLDICSRLKRIKQADPSQDIDDDLQLFFDSRCIAEKH